MNDSNEGTPGARYKSLRELFEIELRLSTCFSRNNKHLIAIIVYTAFNFFQLFYKQLILHSKLMNDIGLTSNYKLEPQSVLRTARRHAGLLS